MNVIDYSWDFTKEEFSLDLDFFNEKEQEDKLWQARTGLNHETLCGAIETIIFMSDKPVTLQKIKTQIDSDLPLRVVHESIARLQEEYEAKHHGIRLMEVAQGYQFRTKATYSNIVKNMFKVSSMQLSPTALEVLAIIAYKQPISKTSIESIRGVDSSHIVRQLMDKRLVRITGRSDEMGRPSLYGTSNEFLEVFNLNEITELPSESELNELATASDVASINEIKSIVQTGEKSKFDFDELEELDQLSNSIKEIASETIFTKSLVDMDKKRSTEEGVEKKSAFDLLEEYVSKAQIVEQNKASTVSELITNIIEPKAVDPTSSEELFNVPRLDEDEFDFSELPKSELVLEDDFDDSDIISLESSLEDTNLQAEEAMNELSSIDEENLEDAPELKEPISFDEAEGGQEINFEAKELSDALDAAFDDLMGPSEDSESEEETVEKIDLSGINAQDLDLDIDFLTDKE
ncbi:MAG: SMC-Scp complex subunit ScpB [Halobacteriovoraceae bacterium]|nr:SMC-Scp complex subunit ScpB [Halobacteriovoraceae bacterium]|tara:strand:- start:14254 stop:15642 length:1389 start_codon:yes stop_codon:yes gene_type:complete